MPPRSTTRALANAMVCVAAVAAAPARSADAVEAQPASEPAAAQAQEARFDIWEIRVLGNTVLPSRDIERTVYPYLGPGRSMTDVESARASLEKDFHDQGYGTVFVDIPEQEVSDGVVRLRVTEGKLNAVRLRGARYFSGQSILSAVPAATVGTVPHLPTLQGEISEVNARTADRSVTPVLKAGPVPGTVDLDLGVNEQFPLHAGLVVNNDYTADTTHLRAVASLSYDNMFSRLDSLSLLYQTAPEKTSEVGVLAAGYVARLGGSDAQLAASYLHSDSDVAAVGVLGVLGKGDVAGLRYIKPLSVARDGSHTLTLGVEYKDFTESIQLDAENSLQTPISYLNWIAGYDGFWRHGDLSLSTSVNANLGVRGLGNDPGEFADKRYRAEPNYFYLRGEATVAAPLPWQLSLLVGLAAQAAVEPVVQTEQFPIGGSAGPRGYLEAEALGDSGVKAGLQVAGPKWNLLGQRLDASAYAFADYGWVGTLQPLPGEESATNLGSVGLGLDIHALARLTGSIVWAYPLLDGPYTKAGDTRILFSVASTW